jgi:antitoxin component YwqK of YwqJK toxin-antitoxin module
MKRVPEKALDYTDDGYYCLDEQPFTGVGFSLHKEGWLEMETEYRDGTEWGMRRQWYAPNKLLEEVRMRAGVVHGKERRWHPNGKLKEESDCEFGITLTRKTWDEEGNLVEDFKLNETDTNFASLQKMRELYKDDLEREKREKPPK